nr:MAG TPA: cytoskeleton assembly control protein [Caudoviricetes sp.]
MKTVKVRLLDEHQVIRVQMWTNGAWRHNIRGTVIGSHDGIVGVLLDSGEYVDVPEERLKIIS